MCLCTGAHTHNILFAYAWKLYVEACSFRHYLVRQQELR